MSSAIKLIIIALFLSSCASSKHSEFSSINDLIRNSSVLNNEIVSVEGILILEFEDINLYSSRKEARKQINMDTECISLSVTKEVYSKWHSRSGSHVVVSGKLNSEFCGANQICLSSCNDVGLEDISISLK